MLILQDVVHDGARKYRASGDLVTGLLRWLMSGVGGLGEKDLALLECMSRRSSIY